MIRGATLALGVLVAPNAFAQTATGHSCAGGVVLISGGDAHTATAICEASLTAVELFQRCDLPDLPAQTRIEVVDALAAGCNAMFHCEENRIAILDPQAMAAQRRYDGPFGFLSNDDFFASVVVHELAHAMADGQACPIGDCPASDEYLSYALQVMSMNENDIARFESRSGRGQHVSRDDLSALSLFLSPGGFAQKVWSHLQQRPDACAYLGQIARREILLDRERF